MATQRCDDSQEEEVPAGATLCAENAAAARVSVGGSVDERHLRGTFSTMAHVKDEWSNMTTL